jgi:hypothetical protein
MKKLSFLFVLGLLLFAAKANAQSGNANALENRAVAAAHACVQPHHGPHTIVYAELVGQGRCLDGGTVNTYAVKVAYTAPPPVLPYVLLPAPITVATVVFDCDNDVASVTCE